MYLPNFQSAYRGLALALLLSLPLAAANSAEPIAPLVAGYASDDHELRFESRVGLEALVVQAGAPGRHADRSSIEAELLQAIAEAPSVRVSLWLMQQLQHVASDASVETLSRLLDDEDPRIVDGAHMALQSIPGAKAEAALIAALSDADSSHSRIGLLQAIGQRQSEKAIEIVAPLIESPDSATANAAIAALAQIGGPRAGEVLEADYGTAAGSAKTERELALLQLDADPRTLRRLALESENRTIRSGSFAQLAANRPSEARTLLQEALAAPGFSYPGDLLRIAITSSSRPLRNAALAPLPELTPEAQLAVLGALPDRPNQSLENAALRLVESDNEAVVLEALNALAHVGSHRSLPLLLSTLESRDRSRRERAAHALTLLDDPRIDRELLKASRQGDEETRIVAIKALGFRNSPGAVPVLNAIARNDSSEALRREALSALEKVGDASSFKTLVDIVVAERDASRLRRAAQLGLKRMSLRSSDAQAIWQAFETGLQADEEAQLDLIAIIDSAPTPEAIAYLERIWKSGAPERRAAALRVLPGWRNWDGGRLMLALIEDPASSEEERDALFSGLARLILGSDTTYSLDEKFEIAHRALELAPSEAQRQQILGAFRYSEWRERNYVTRNEVDPELKQAVLDAASS